MIQNLIARAARCPESGQPCRDSFLTTALDGGDRSNSRPGRFTTAKRAVGNQ